MFRRTPRLNSDNTITDAASRRACSVIRRSGLSNASAASQSRPGRSEDLRKRASSAAAAWKTYTSGRPEVSCPQPPGARGAVRHEHVELPRVQPGRPAARGERIRQRLRQASTWKGPHDAEPLFQLDPFDRALVPWSDDDRLVAARSPSARCVRRNAGDATHVVRKPLIRGDENAHRLELGGHELEQPTRSRLPRILGCEAPPPGDVRLRTSASARAPPPRRTRPDRRRGRPPARALRAPAAPTRRPAFRPRDTRRS